MRRKSLLLIIISATLLLIPFNVEAITKYGAVRTYYVNETGSITKKHRAQMIYNPPVSTATTTSITATSLYFESRSTSSSTWSPEAKARYTWTGGGDGWSGLVYMKFRNYKAGDKKQVLGTRTVTWNRECTASTKYLYGNVLYYGNGYKRSPEANRLSTATSDAIIVPALQRYAVTYNANGGTGAPGNNTGTNGCNDSTGKVYGKTFTLSATQPIRTGYTFNGWNRNALGTGTNYAPGGSYTGNAAVTLYAKWVPNTYTVKFDANGGTGTMPDQPFAYDEEKTLPANTFTRTNHRFIGWNTKADGTGTSYTNGESVKNLTATNNGVVTLYAQWVVDAPILITENGEEVEKDSSGNYIFKNVRSTGRLRICKQVR